MAVDSSVVSCAARQALHEEGRSVVNTTTGKRAETHAAAVRGRVLRQAHRRAAPAALPALSASLLCPQSGERRRTCAAVAASYSTPSSLLASFSWTMLDTSLGLNLALCAWGVGRVRDRHFSPRAPSQGAPHLAVALWLQDVGVLKHRGMRQPGRVTGRASRSHGAGAAPPPSSAAARARRRVAADDAHTQLRRTAGMDSMEWAKRPHLWSSNQSSRTLDGKVDARPCACARNARLRWHGGRHAP